MRSPQTRRFEARSDRTVAVDSPRCECASASQEALGSLKVTEARARVSDFFPTSSNETCDAPMTFEAVTPRGAPHDIPPVRYSPRHAPPARIAPASSDSFQAGTFHVPHSCHPHPCLHPPCTLHAPHPSSRSYSFSFGTVPAATPYDPTSATTNVYPLCRVARVRLVDDDSPPPCREDYLPTPCSRSHPGRAPRPGGTGSSARPTLDARGGSAARRRARCSRSPPCPSTARASIRPRWVRYK